MSDLPPIPEGFQLVSPSVVAPKMALPPIPQGYQLVDHPSFGDTLKSAVTNLPSNIYEAGRSALSTINDTLNPWSDANEAAANERAKNPSLAFTDWTRAGRGLAAIPEVAMAPATGVIKSAAPVIAQAETAGIRAVGEPIAKTLDPNAKLPSYRDVYERVEPDVETALTTVMPGRRSSPLPVPPRPKPGPMGVTLSEGQETGDLSAIQREQAALRGQSGKLPQAQAQHFADQQKQQVETLKERIAKSLNPFGQVVAESPQEAGQAVSQSVGATAAQRKADVTKAYDVAKSLPGEIHASAFDDIGNAIKTDLTTRAEPVIIDEKLTPFADRAITEIEKTVEPLRVPNRASPYPQPKREDIAGVTLEGVEQMRKRLSALRKDAFSSGNGADGRAMRAVIDAFDSRIDAAVNGGLFKGDPLAVKAWNNVRAAHADYRKTFTAGKNDPIGRVVERILGKGDNPAAIPNDVADFMYGSSGINPSSLNVGVAGRIRNILGDKSPEWSGVKQGLFSRLVDSGQGVTDFGPGKVAQRINKFVNVDGKELSQVVFSSSERALLMQYAVLMRRLEVPQAGANWSNTATFTAKALDKIGGRLGIVIGAIVGRAIAPGLPWGLGDAIGAGVAAGAGSLGEVSQARKIAKQMPILSDQIAKWQKASARAAMNSTRSTRLALTVSINNLAHSLAGLGIEFPALEGPGIGGADQNQQDVPRPPGQ